MSNDDIGPSSSPHQCPGAASGQRSEDCVLAGGCLVSAQESAGSCALRRCHHGHCVLRSEIIHHQVTSPRSGVSVSTLPAATAASSCTRAISGEAPPRCVPSWTRRGVRRHLIWRPTVPPSLSTPMSALHRWRGRGWSTPGLTSDCPLQLDTVRSLISQSSLRTLV